MNFIFNLIKFLLFILLIPVVVILSVGFCEGVWSLPNRAGINFIWGAGSFLVFHLFVLELKGVFEFGKITVSGLLKFLGPMSEAAAYAIPIFSLLTLLSFYFTGLALGVARPDKYFMFFTGFTLALHLVYSADFLKEAGGKGISASYYFYISLVVIVNLALVALCFSLLFEEFSFIELFKSVAADAEHIYRTVFRQLFVK